VIRERSITSGDSVTSKPLRTGISAAVGLLCALVVAACSDLPTGPGLESGGGDSVSLTDARLFACPTPDFGAVTQRVGPEGARIEIGPHVLIIPPGAISDAVDITASAPASAHVRVSLQPHGLQFQYDATLLLSYKHCKPRPQRQPKIAYVDEVGSSILDLLPSKHDRFNKAVAGSLGHFSGYAIAD
jgi:hypothetical protein